MNEAKKHNQAIINPISCLAVETDATLNLIISIKICQYCKAEIRQGVKHNCNMTERRLNMVEQLRTASKTTLETVTGAGLKEVERLQQGLASAGGGSPTSCEAS